MSHTCSIRVGDKGQRYEVRYKDGKGREFVMGWSDDPTALVEMVKLHPVWTSPRVIDRKPTTTEWVETQCTCPRCVRMCENNPCFGTPEEIDKIIDAGLGDNLRPYYSTNKAGNTIESIQPASVGEPETNPQWPDGPCRFLSKGLCTLHDMGLKPFEGRMAFHDNHEPIRDYIIPQWNSDIGHAVVGKWKNKTHA